MPNLNRRNINEGLALTLLAQMEAGCYANSLPELEYLRSDKSLVRFKVNNHTIYDFLKCGLQANTFKSMFQTAEKQGVFDLSFEHHVPRVTLNAGALHMTRKWPRDHAGMLPLIAQRYPDELWPGLQTLAESYCGPVEIKGFEKVFQNPASFKRNHGIAHVFWLNSRTGKLNRDHQWEMNQRIESHSEFLRVLTQATNVELSQSQPTHLSPKIIKTIVYFTHYLHALGINPPTCGPWEEIPFAKGSNWDCASVIMAFEAVIELQKTLSKYPDILADFLKVEEKLSTKNKRPLLFLSPNLLISYNHKSLLNIRKYHLDEFRGMTNRVDSSSTMLAATDLNLSPSNDFAEDISLHLEILEHFRNHLVGEFGAKRYNAFKLKIGHTEIFSCDSYLNLNSDVLLDKSGNIFPDKKQKTENADASASKCFIKRAKDCTEQYSAQWGLPLSYAALAYAKQVDKLLQKSKEQNLDEQELNLLKMVHNGEMEFIARSYANITGPKYDGSIPRKANGEYAIMWKKPEAYQCISPSAPNGVPSFLPGVNSHLGWDAAICWQASQLILQNLIYLEQNRLL